MLRARGEGHNLPVLTCYSRERAGCRRLRAISKDDQGDHLGVDRQERACRQLAADRGLEVAHLCVDNDTSAYARKPRPGFEHLVDLLKAGEVGAVIAYHANRLYRRVGDLERLVGVVEATATGEFIRSP